MIRYADSEDFPILKECDKHISESELRNSIRAKRVLVLYENGDLIGWLRFGLFWDNIPFMNMLYILDGYREKGNGKQLVTFWEEEMAKENYGQVLTSTQSNEQAQFFYRKMGYTECGALLLPKEPLEMIFIKDLYSGGSRHEGSCNTNGVDKGTKAV